MIFEGSVGLYTQNGMHVMTYVDGDTFGDQDALLNENRDAKCMALT